MKLQFSGHESFICKHFWLKKGYDFLSQNENFNDELAVVEFGVGKNMVSSISYWLKAFGITDQSNQITEFGHYIFNDRTGKDPYIENIGTLWLLHYSLIKTNKASIYNIFFNEFRRGKTQFTKNQLANYVFRKIEQESKANINTINADIAVLIRSYLVNDYKSSKVDIEDDFSNLLLDLELMKNYQIEDASGKNVEWYQVESTVKTDLPSSIVLYTILNHPQYGYSIPFRELLTGTNSPGIIFALNEEGLFQKIEQIMDNHKNIVYTESAGIKELQIKGSFNAKQILDDYYKN